MRHVRSRDNSSNLCLLCSMMEISDKSSLKWSLQDLSDMLKFLLATPLTRELEHVTLCEINKKNVRSKRFSSVTCGELLMHIDTNHEALYLAKEYAKTAMDDESLLPHDVAKAFYVAIIAHARALKIDAFSTLSDVQFERLARWGLAQIWIPDSIRTVIRQGLPCKNISTATNGAKRNYE